MLRNEDMVMEYVRKATVDTGCTQSAVTSEHQDSQSKIEKSQKASFPVAKPRAQEKVIVVTPPRLQYIPPDDERPRHEDVQVTRQVEIVLQIDRMLFSDRGTTPTDDIGGSKEMKG